MGKNSEKEENAISKGGDGRKVNPSGPVSKGDGRKVNPSGPVSKGDGRKVNP